MMAEDAKTVRESFLKIFHPHIIEQIKNSVYIYDLAQMNVEIPKIDAAKTPQAFSFLPLAGGRPPKQLAHIPSTEIQQLQQNEINKKLNQTRQETLSPENLELLRNVGAMPLQSSANEGVNLRVNTSVGLGKNVNVNNFIKTTPTENLNQAHLDLLNSVGVNVHELNALYENGVTITDKIENPAIDHSGLADIGSEKPMSVSELEELQKQIRGENV